MKPFIKLTPTANGTLLALASAPVAFNRPFWVRYRDIIGFDYDSGNNVTILYVTSAPFILPVDGAPGDIVGLAGFRKLTPTANIGFTTTRPLPGTFSGPFWISEQTIVAFDYDSGADVTIIYGDGVVICVDGSPADVMALT